MYWAQELNGRFAKLAETLAENEDTILAELDAVQGEPVDLGGYYYVDKDKATAAMRPSATLNAAIAEL
jgi:isocitrate dehydrogenase